MGLLFLFFLQIGFFNRMRRQFCQSVWFPMLDCVENRSKLKSWFGLDNIKSLWEVKYELIITQPQVTYYIVIKITSFVYNEDGECERI